MRGFTSIQVFLLFVLFTISHADSRPAFDNFLGCLSYQSNPSNPISQSLVQTPNDSSYKTAFLTYVNNRRFENAKTSLRPLAIITPLHESHVQAVVVCAKLHGIQIRTRSGGHDYEGLSYTSSVPFVILDMFNLRAITVDVSSKSAWVESGATLGELYTKIAESSETLAFPAGVCPTVGAGGHFSGGGYGNLLRKYGLSVDNILDAKLVDANGKVLDRSTMGEDLFWAIRGGGGASFGVILSWKLRLVSVPKHVTVFKVNKTLEEGAVDVTYKWQTVASKLPKELFIRATHQITNSSSKPGEKTMSVFFYAEFLGPADKLVTILNRKLPELGLARKDCTEMSWLNSTLFWMDYPAGTPTSILLERPTGPGSFYKSKSDYVKTPIPKEGIEKIWKGMFKIGAMFMQWNPYGGVMDRIPESATPFPHRKGNLYKIQYFATWNQEGENATNYYLNLMKEFYDDVSAPYVSSNPREAFLNYRDLDIGRNPSNQTNLSEGSVYGFKYFKGNFKRLMEVKAKYDPENFFKNEQSIAPAKLGF